MYRLSLFALCTLVLFTQVMAGDAVRTAVHALDPSGVITSVRQGPMAGMSTVTVDGHAVYVSNDGRYVFQGDIYDLKKGVDLAEVQADATRVSALATIPLADRILFAPPHPAYRVTIFTDFDCPYCHMLESQIDAYLKNGIALEFVAWPRAGVGSRSFIEAERVWCAPNRQRAFRDAYAGTSVPDRTCRSPVSGELRVAQSLNLPGTPSIISADGTLLGGYLSPGSLRRRLDALRRREADQ